jgi:hypothetical protein
MNGILFKPDNHLAIREYRKTVTRRIVDFKLPDSHRVYKYVYPHPNGGYSFQDFPSPSGMAEPICKVGKMPRYHVGEIVYIKEAYEFYNCLGGLANVKYFLDNEVTWVHKPKDKPMPKKGYHSPLMLPEWVARDFIQIVSVRPERLQDITEEDAIKEGIQIMQGTHQAIVRDEETGKLKLTGKPEPFTARYHYSALWDVINGDGSWDSNLWVFRYEFKRVPKLEING